MQKGEIGIHQKVIHIFQSSCQQVVYTRYLVAVSNEAVTQMRTDEPGSTGDQCFGCLEGDAMKSVSIR